jgi:hypothetical protein
MVSPPELRKWLQPFTQGHHLALTKRTPKTDRMFNVIGLALNHSARLTK